MTAIGANGMRQAHFPTIAALNQVCGFQRVLRTAAITPAF